MKSKVINPMKKFPNIIRGFGTNSTLQRGLMALACAITLLCLNAVPLWATDHSGTITSDTTWYAADNPHVIVGNVTVQAAVTLILEDGVNVRFDYNKSIDVYGTLTAVGTPGTGILFTRSGGSNGNGLRFYTGGRGTFDYCTIEYCMWGIQTSSTDTISVSNSTIQNNNFDGMRASGGTVSISNSTIQNNYTDGVYASGGTVQLTNTALTNNGTGFYGDGVIPILLDTNTVVENNQTGIHLVNIAGLSLTTAPPIRNNTGVGLQIVNCSNCILDSLTLQGNGGSAIYMQNTGEFTLGSDNDISGNGWPVGIDIGSYPSASCAGNIPTAGSTNDDIQVGGGSSADTITWRKFTDLDYIITGSATISAGGELTLEPGVNVRFDYNKSIDVYGTLTAVGTPGTGILFTRSGGSNGNGLRFYTGGRGTFDYCTIEYCMWGIQTSSTDTISVSNSTIQNNGYDGVRASGGTVQLTNTTLTNNGTGVWAQGSTLSFINNEIINNSSYGIHLSGAVPVSFGSDLSEWNDIYGNGPGSDGRDLYLNNDTLDTYAPYIYWGTINGAEIEAQIWDKVDDLALGKVCYAPWSNAAHDWAIPTWLTIALESGAKSSSGDMRLVWSEYCDTAGVDHYVVYRSTAAYTKGDSLTGTTDIEYLDAGVVGDVNTHYYYTVEVVDGVGNRLDSNQVGEFDRGLLAK